MELKAHVWFPTLIWQMSLPESEKPALSEMKDFILDVKNKEPEGVRKTNYGGWQSETYSQFPESFKLNAIFLHWKGVIPTSGSISS